MNSGRRLLLTVLVGDDITDEGDDNYDDDDEFDYPNQAICFESQGQMLGQKKNLGSEQW